MMEDVRKLPVNPTRSNPYPLTMKQFKALTPEQKEYYFIQSTTKAVTATKSRGGVDDIGREDAGARAMRQEESWFRREYDYKG